MILSFSSSSLAEKQGRVIDGRYFSPQKGFSFAVPDLGPNATTKDGYVDAIGAGGVHFHDDFGTVVAVQYNELAPWFIQKWQADSGRIKILEEISADLLEKEKVAPDAALQRWFHEVVYPDVLASFGSEILYEDLFQIKGQRAYFTVVHIPQGSTVIIQTTTPTSQTEPKVEDSIRGFLLFVNGSRIYMLQQQPSIFYLKGKGLLQLGHKGTPPIERSWDELKGYLKEELSRLYGTFQFE